ncbi:MAG: acyl-CoA dehydrogenase family protein [Pseudomonadota bacterium]
MAALSEEQNIIRDQAKSWTTDTAPVTAFRAMRDSGAALKFDGDTWQAMVDMGWTGLIVPERFGGSGLGYLTFGLILEELGRQLTASPLFASAYAGASALLVAGDEAQQGAWLPKVVDGSALLTLAVDEGPRHDPANLAMTAEANADGYLLQGAKTFVMEGMAATDFVVAAKVGDELGLFMVAADAAGVSRDALATMDSRGYANVRFDAVQVAADARLGGDATAALDEILDRCRAGLGAEMIGTAAQAFDMTLEYLKTRKQFGRVIGSFQALGHRAAELFGAMELARSCAEAALTAIDEAADDRAMLCSLSKCRVGDFLHEMSNQLIQIHGGIGMTDEFDAGFYLKRARVLETAFGNQAYHRDRYARLNGF